MYPPSTQKGGQNAPPRERLYQTSGQFHPGCARPAGQTHESVISRYPDPYPPDPLVPVNGERGRNARTRGQKAPLHFVFIHLTMNGSVLPPRLKALALPKFWKATRSGLF